MVKSKEIHRRYGSIINTLCWVDITSEEQVKSLLDDGFRIHTRLGKEFSVEDVLDYVIDTSVGIFKETYSCLYNDMCTVYERDVLDAFISDIISKYSFSIIYTEDWYKDSIVILVDAVNDYNSDLI